MRIGSLMCAVLAAISLIEPSLARETSEFTFFRQSINNWQIEAITEVEGEKELLVKEVRCQATNHGISITLFRSDPPILNFSYHYQDAEGETSEIPESELDWVEIDDRRLKTRHRAIPYHEYRFSNFTYSKPLEEGALMFGGGLLELREADGPWLHGSSYLLPLMNSRSIKLSYHGLDAREVRLSTMGLRRALRICSEQLSSSAALTLPPDWMR